MVDLGMAFLDNWVVGKEVCYWLSNDIFGLVGFNAFCGFVFTVILDLSSTAPLWVCVKGGVWY